MKIVKGILITLAALFVLFGGLVIASAFNPSISEAIGDILYAGRGTTVETQVPMTTEQTAVQQTATEVQPTSSEETEPAEEGQPSSYYTDSSNVSTKVTVDWNDRYTARAEALAEEEAKQAAASASTKYTPPNEKNIKIPNAVAGRAAYTEIKDQGETLND